MEVEQQYREEIVRYGRLLHQKGFVAATDGNLTVRLDAERILSTPTGISKGMMEPDDLVVVDQQGRKISGRRQVSTEIGMHLLIYRLRPAIRAVVHAHPTTATGYAAARVALTKPLITEVVLSLGSVPLAGYATPGTPEVAAALEPLVPNHDAILMANHGVVTCGDTLLNAYMKMEQVEHFAKIALVTHVLGQQHPISDSDLESLIASRGNS